MIKRERVSFSCLSFLSSLLCSFDDRHVVFGRVISGMSVLRKIRDVGVRSNARAGKPIKKVQIMDSNEL